MTEPSSINPYVFVSVIIILVMVSQWLMGFVQHRQRQDDRFEPKMSPSPVEKFATKPELEKLDGKLAAHETKTDRTFRETAKAASDSRKEVYDRLRALEKGQVSNETLLQAIASRQAETNLKIDKLNDKIR